MKLTDLGLDNEDLDMIALEDIEQLRQWGNQEHPITRTWLSLLQEEMGELAKAINENQNRPEDRKKIISEAVQTATLALKIAVMVRDQDDPLFEGCNGKCWEVEKPC